MKTAKTTKFASMFGGAAAQTQWVKKKLALEKQMSMFMDEQQLKFEQENKKLQEKHDKILLEQKKLEEEAKRKGIIGGSLSSSGRMKRE